LDELTFGLWNLHENVKDLLVCGVQSLSVVGTEFQHAKEHHLPLLLDELDQLNLRHFGLNAEHWQV